MISKMANKSKKKVKNKTDGTIAFNRKLAREFNVIEKFEAGIALLGTEVKALRTNGANFIDAYAIIKKNEAWLLNLHISQYNFSHQNLNHDPKRTRKLLLHKKQINKLTVASKNKGSTMIPSRIYNSNRGIIKIELCLVTGKKMFDKRKDEQKQSFNLAKQRLLRGEKL